MFPVSISAPYSMETGIGQNPERRKRPRIQAHWPVWIWKSSGELVNTRTINISSDGFFCRTTQSFAPGEKPEVVIEVPAPSANHNDKVLQLRCEVVIVRVEKSSQGAEYGIAFRILNYSVLTGAGTRAPQGG